MNSEESAFSEATEWRGASSLWNGRRRRLRAAIARVDELYSDLYRRAVDALSEQPLTPGAVVVAGHCIRDLVNGLPDALPDGEAVPAYSDLAEPARQLANVWTEHEEVLGPAVVENPASSEEELSSDGRATVPRGVIVAARKVVAASIAGRGNSRRRHSALVLGRVEAGQDPTVKIFSESVRAFEKVRHPGRGRKVEIRAGTLQGLEKALETIEAALESRLGSFFQVVDDLMDVLDAANKRGESSAGD